jgi:hypothetical protein
MRARRSKSRIALLVVLIALGVAGVVVSQRDHFESDHPALAHVLLAFGEAFLVAGLLALAADPFVQRRFAEEWGRELFWAIFNRDAPDAMRKAVNVIAQPEKYIAHGEWTVDLTWVDADHSKLNVAVESERRIVCVDPDGWSSIKAGSGIVPDCEGNPSQFTGFRVNAKGWSARLDESNIGKYVTVDENGNASLQPAPLLKGHRIGYREETVFTTRMSTTMRSVDSIPLFSRQTGLSWTITVKGPAVEDLFIELFGSDAPEVEADGETPQQKRFKSKPGDVSWPGHGLVLQCRPSAEPRQAVSAPL